MPKVEAIFEEFARLFLTLIEDKSAVLWHHSLIYNYYGPFMFHIDLILLNIWLIYLCIHIYSMLLAHKKSGNGNFLKCPF